MPEGRPVKPLESRMGGTKTNLRFKEDPCWMQLGRMS